MTADTEERTWYVNKPGGVIVRLADGPSETLRYGQPVPMDRLADHQRATVPDFADTQFRGDTGDARLEAAAHARAAQAAYQPGSSASPVPSNYGDLSEEQAVVVMNRLSDTPERQAALVVHEQLHGGNRRRVVDAATGVARQLADAQIDVLQHRQDALGQRTEQLGGVLSAPRAVRPDPAPTLTRQIDKDTLVPPPIGTELGDREQVTDDPGVQDQVDARHADGGQVVDVADWDDGDTWTRAKLTDYAEQHGVEGFPRSGKRDEMVDALAKAGHDKPQTPPSED